MESKNVWKKFARSILGHCDKGHVLRVQVIPECEADLDLYCIFCGVSLAMGSPAMVNELAQRVYDIGYAVVKQNDPCRSVRLH